MYHIQIFQIKSPLDCIESTLSEETQGKGISKQLMRYIENRAINNGSELIWLDCMDSKIQAMRFYEKNGFQKGSLTFLNYELIKDGFNGMYLMWKSIAKDEENK